ncbi:hypothetical protein Sste5346_000997 [Sporothrix stenoceras]|uniref:CUE domain-containing protein n=1 Tax=Sporothrix stenoceras TaxID=5173 RepID=A0ABR3ZQ67_9PEZI
MANDEINVPSLVLILVVSGFIIRHFFFRGSSPTNGARGSSEASARGAAAAGAGAGGQSRDQRRAEAQDRRIEAAVEHIQQIFPYADRREVWWDLRRNNVNVAATTERILSGRLDTPPVTFQPPAPPSRPSASAAAGGAAGASSAAKSSQPSLIQRYKLENKVAEASGADSPTPFTPSPSPSTGKTKNWSSNRDERQNMLKKRRDDMILEARRKMEAKLAAEKAKAAEAAGGASTSS